MDINGFRGTSEILLAAQNSGPKQTQRLGEDPVVDVAMAQKHCPLQCVSHKKHLEASSLSEPGASLFLPVQTRPLILDFHNCQSTQAAHKRDPE